MDDPRPIRISLLDSIKFDCLVITYTKSNRIRKRIIPIRNLRDQLGDEQNFQDVIKLAIQLHTDHQLFIKCVPNRLLLKQLLILQHHKKCLDWTKCEAWADEFLKIYNSEIEQVESLASLLKITQEKQEDKRKNGGKKQVSFNETPQKYQFEKYEGEEEYLQNLLHSESKLEDEGSKIHHLELEEDEDFVF